MRTLSIFFLLVGLSCFSQKSAAVIEYKIFNNGDTPNTLYAKLYTENQNTIYIANYNTQVYNDAKYEAKRTRIDDYAEYLKVDHKKKEILFYEYLGQNAVLVKDEYNNLKWDITGETKTIAGYACIKATTSFRGREWIAWFAPEIPLPYGPWKLHGLPGLIIEVTDATNTYSWSAEKVEYRRDPVFDKDFNALLKTRNKKPMTLKQYMDDDAEWNANLDAKMKILTPGMGEVVYYRGGYELKYEWEE
ncbi:GLPGLI family protein [Flavobacterium sp. DG1-102-2]|uniref:GLPGLI family protein n=1 Tax=Flavobacterium sp. DG1-102-2 TaxID=3081663 RepID=UPI00294A0074|nr:GLPGLI family protein [Flavobacterium sp. DG1-102-2]MDV6167520.1 GLPGLI family protein [Flavobacterium sp. DG1-102-2]